MKIIFEIELKGDVIQEIIFSMARRDYQSLIETLKKNIATLEIEIK